MHSQDTEMREKGAESGFCTSYGLKSIHTMFSATLLTLPSLVFIHAAKLEHTP